MLVIVILGLLGSALAYPHGAPKESCTNLNPQHGYDISGKKGRPPYSIDINDAMYYRPNEHVKVTIRTEGPDFKGFILQARKVGTNMYSGDHPIGHFEKPDQNDDVKLMQCGDSGYDDTITHSNNNKKGSRTFVWHPPQENHGNIEFRATVVQSKRVYWLWLNSTKLYPDYSSSGSNLDWKQYYMQSSGVTGHNPFSWAYGIAMFFGNLILSNCW